MTVEEYLEFLTMLLVENKCLKQEEFLYYVDKKCNINKFNNRYGDLLDKFLNQYVVTKAEKSD